jgi:protein-disulfide isomerase
MVALAAALVWQGRARFFDSTSAKSPIPTAPVPKNPIDIDDDTTKGASSARLAIIEYADFQCSACRQFARTFAPPLIHEYVDTGRAKFVFKDFPLAAHLRAGAAAAAGWCAARQGQFWRVHDWLFTSPSNLDDDILAKPAGVTGLDVASYNACRSGEKASEHVLAERAEGDALHIMATPTFFIGRATADHKVLVTDTIVGATSVESFKRILDRLER